MTLLALPRTRHCLVCGKDNPVGHRLRLAVEPASGEVVVEWAPGTDHAGFENIVHGGATATVLDEAMAWTSIWNRKRMCVCGELTLRFRKPVSPGGRLMIRAKVDQSRGRVVLASATLADSRGAVLVEATGKYLLGSDFDHATMLANLLEEPESAMALQALRSAGRGQ